MFNLQVGQEVDRPQNLLPCSADAEVEQPNLRQVAKAQEVQASLHIGVGRAGWVHKADVDVQASQVDVAVLAIRLQSEMVERSDDVCLQAIRCIQEGFWAVL